MAKGNVGSVQEAVEGCQAILRNGYTNDIEEHELYGMTLEKDLLERAKQSMCMYIMMESRWKKRK